MRMSKGPLFLENTAYRRRRLGDAARILPVVALLAVMLPVWWVPGAVSFAGGTLALFILWTALVIGTALLHRALMRADRVIREAEVAVAAPDAGEEPMPDRAADGG